MALLRNAAIPLPRNDGMIWLWMGDDAKGAAIRARRVLGRKIDRGQGKADDGR